MTFKKPFNKKKITLKNNPIKLDLNKLTSISFYGHWIQYDPKTSQIGDRPTKKSKVDKFQKYIKFQIDWNQFATTRLPKKANLYGIGGI